jgi:hypothetical protein
MLMFKYATSPAIHLAGTWNHLKLWPEVSLLPFNVLIQFNTITPWVDSAQLISPYFASAFSSPSFEFEGTSSTQQLSPGARLSVSSFFPHILIGISEPLTVDDVDREGGLGAFGSLGSDKGVHLFICAILVRLKSSRAGEHALLEKGKYHHPESHCFLSSPFMRALASSDGQKCTEYLLTS